MKNKGIGGKRRLAGLARSSSALTAVGLLTIMQGVATREAAAQDCSTSANPVAGTASHIGLDNSTFSTDGVSAKAITDGRAGCQGADGPSNVSGQAGFAGEPGWVDNNVTGTNFTIIGTMIDREHKGRGASLMVFSRGGAGGRGGNSGSVANAYPVGGNGGVGGAGGTVTVTTGAFTLKPTTPTGVLERGLYATVDGGIGGGGGDSNQEGLYGHYGGIGGLGGAGGEVTVKMESLPVVTGGGAGEVPSGEIAIVTADGGAGGNGGGAPTNWAHLSSNHGEKAGNGGKGGVVSFQLGDAAVMAKSSASLLFSGVTVSAVGGNGGVGGGAEWSTAASSGGDGGKGGDGNQASIDLQAYTALTVTRSEDAGGNPITGLFVKANGGNGGTGGQSGAALGAHGGKGGAGGQGGEAKATVAGDITIKGDYSDLNAGSAGVRVEANGGLGGAGTSTSALVGDAGGSGLAGDGGTATVVVAASGHVTTEMDETHGVMAQSVGGGGGYGGNAKLASFAGEDTAGGKGGTVHFDLDGGDIDAQGSGSRGVVAQSVGGGGGLGGDKSTVAVGVGLAIGGNGGHGGDGGEVTATMTGGTIGSTGNEGLLVQSIGGGGGAGGSAVSKGVGLFALTIGGDAGAGGKGGPVSATNSGATIGSYGASAAAMMVQSVGGGGGKGGMAATLNAGVVASIGVAVGGKGAIGGSGGTATATNEAAGQLQTYGSDAVGMLVQSVGGGGGAGGSSVARVLAISPKSDVPEISASLAVGGQAGSGNTGGTASGTNAGMITTAGEKSTAMFVQSVGGSGGKGGDATASSYSGSAAELEDFSEGKFAKPTASNIEISVAVALGGKGGSGALGGDATGVNGSTGFLGTFGQDAYGMQVQSIGGGGGDGGAGDASASTSAAKTSYSAALSVGGTGGKGGNGGKATGGNAGSIATSGDGADGAFIQSVGGGGGSAGGGVANAGGGDIAVSLAVGGDGGAGGSGAAASFENTGDILTRGADAVGVFAQSVGGGGGKAGKGAATVGGSTRGVISNSQKLFDLLAGGFGTPTDSVATVDKIYKYIGYLDKVYGGIEQMKDNWGYIKNFREKGETPEVGLFKKVTIGIGVGGRGGAAGNGGTVTVGNSQAIATEGAQSDGIQAQSVGGGGGTGGSASASAKSGNDATDQVALSVGGKGGAAGDGGAVTVTTDRSASISTMGAGAFGINAQSVGGGGGEGSFSGSIAGSLRSLAVGIGGDQGAHGNGGAVKVEASGGIETSGKQAIGIFAQSVGGGGGLVRTNDIKDTFNAMDLLSNNQGRLFDVHGLQLTFGGKASAGGTGGTVTVDANSGQVVTSGRNAHGILAQSVGGGGGSAVGGQATNFGFETNGAGGTGNDGGVVSVTTNAYMVKTTGDGAYAIFAQSVGGGGGTGGDVAFTAFTRKASTKGTTAGAKGNGGAISVAVSDQSLIETSGEGAHALVAQTVGGGGGLVANTPTGADRGTLVRGTAAPRAATAPAATSRFPSRGIRPSTRPARARPASSRKSTEYRHRGGRPARSRSRSTPVRKSRGGSSTRPSSPTRTMTCRPSARWGARATI